MFTERELALLMAFANQTAIAIENAILFARVQATLREITQVKELMENVFASIASGVITSKADDRVMTFNRAAAQILATPPDKRPQPPAAGPAAAHRRFRRATVRAVREQNQS